MHVRNYYTVTFLLSLAIRFSGCCWSAWHYRTLRIWSNLIMFKFLGFTQEGTYPPPTPTPWATEYFGSYKTLLIELWVYFSYKLGQLGDQMLQNNPIKHCYPLSCAWKLFNLTACYSIITMQLPCRMLATKPCYTCKEPCDWKLYFLYHHHLSLTSMLPDSAVSFKDNINCICLEAMSCSRL